MPCNGPRGPRDRNSSSRASAISIASGLISITLRRRGPCGRAPRSARGYLRPVLEWRTRRRGYPIPGRQSWRHLILGKGPETTLGPTVEELLASGSRAPETSARSDEPIAFVKPPERFVSDHNVTCPIVRLPDRVRLRSVGRERFPTLPLSSRRISGRTTGPAPLNQDSKRSVRCGCRDYGRIPPPRYAPK